MTAAPITAAATSRIDELPPEETRGTWAMTLAIVTEALLFVSLFFAYFYVRGLHEDWIAEPPPELKLALTLLVILLVSSGTVELAKHALKKQRAAVARGWLGVTLLLGAAFIAVQIVEYGHRLLHIRPTSNAYGSLFYVITSFHALHVVVGLAMLLFVLALPRLTPSRGPRRPLQNAALYWHFVDAVWIAVVALIYVLPHGGAR